MDSLPTVPIPGPESGMELCPPSVVAMSPNRCAHEPRHPPRSSSSLRSSSRWALPAVLARCAQGGGHASARPRRSGPRVGTGRLRARLRSVSAVLCPLRLELCPAGAGELCWPACRWLDVWLATGSSLEWVTCAYLGNWVRYPGPMEGSSTTVTTIPGDGNRCGVRPAATGSGLRNRPGSAPRDLTAGSQRQV